jgi:galactose-1-phosphate uridylyltransferase
LSEAVGRQIAHLETYVAALPETRRQIFDRIFGLHVATGELVVPSTMRDWVESAFGDVESVCQQRIVKVTNLITMEGALFNPLRGQRPTDFAPKEDVEAAVLATRGGPFCRPLELTPEDVFGRVRGEHCITASNIAKYDGYHGLVIFDDHNPLHITPERVDDYIRTALRWAKRAHNADVTAKYFFLIWNCLWKGGSSIVHGHMQLALGQGMHYARVEHWRRQALLYRLAHGTNYFDDLYAVHEALGLGNTLGETRVIASLTPVKEKEVLLISPTRWVDNADFKRAISEVLSAFLHDLGVQSFNLALFQRPLDTVEEDWEGFPAIVRIVDRGDLHVRTTDVGCMELYGSSVVSTDPFQVISAIKAHP